MMSLLQRFISDPDPDRSRSDYRDIAPQYDASIARIRGIRDDAIGSLDLRPGDSVLDVGCGTGESLLQLARAVGTGGKVVGIEQSAEMAALAHERIAGSGLENRIELIVGPIEMLALEQRFDAILMSFTQDVLQSPVAIARIIGHARPRARIAVAGMCFLSWWWAAPINAFNAWRARRYMSTFRGLRDPCRGLRPSCPDLAVAQRYLLGSCYRARGTVTTSSPSCASR